MPHLLWDPSTTLPLPLYSFLIYARSYAPNSTYYHQLPPTTFKMVNLPKRWVRNIVNVGVVLMLVVLLLVLANDNNIFSVSFLDIHKPWRFGQDQSWQPYVVDVSIEQVLKIKLTKPREVVKDETKGEMGDLHLNGFWAAVPKDLMLGSSWLHKRYLAAKFVGKDYLKTHPHDVIVDFAVSDPEVDGKIKNNAKALIPERVLKDIHKSRIFDEEDRAALEEANKGEKLDGKVDLDEILRLKHEQESQAEDLRAETEKEKEKEKETEKGAKANEEQILNDDKVDQKEDEKSDENEAERDGPVKRTRELSYKSLQGYYLIPKPEQLKKAKWKKLSHGLWVKYGPVGKQAVVNIDVVFGPDAVVPFEGATVLKQPLHVGGRKGMEPRLVFHTRQTDYRHKQIQELRFNKSGKFKVLQIADTHFSTGVGKCRDPVPDEPDCEADPRTVKFIERVLDIEKPDFVVLTGDQVWGEEAPDPDTALFKAVTPLVARKIPYAMVMGNHDDQLIYSREDMMFLSTYLPYSMSALGPEEVDGYGNYGILVRSSKFLKKGVAAFYFLDSHGYSKNPKVTPGYDWFKDSQMWWLENESGLMREQMVKEKPLAMAFFHIPIPEYRNLDQPFIGEHREGITAPNYNSDMRTHFARANVQVATVGHDHCNDYCNKGDEKYESQMWLCYGGGVGLGGYGGYGGYVRRMRIYELDENEGSIKLWKRTESDPDTITDEQRIVDQGKVVNFKE